jgi:hypothetical protein
VASQKGSSVDLYQAGIQPFWLFTVQGQVTTFYKGPKGWLHLSGIDAFCLSHDYTRVVCILERNAVVFECVTAVWLYEVLGMKEQ